MSSVQDENNRYAPPRAEVDDVPQVNTGPQLAGRWRRLGAAIIDTLLVMAALGIVAVLTPWNPFKPANPSLWRFAPLDALLGMVLFLVVEGYPLFTASQTWGKKILGLRIVQADGSPATVGQVIGLRYLLPGVFGVVPALSQLWGVVDALFIFRNSRRCLHDSIAGTTVVRI